MMQMKEEFNLTDFNTTSINGTFSNSTFSGIFNGTEDLQAIQTIVGGVTLLSYLRMIRITV